MMTLKRWNVLEHLTSEEEITAYLEAALEEAPEDIQFYSICLADAAKARIINQLSKETGVDRKVLCAIFLERPEETKPPDISLDVIASLSKAFAVPLHAASL